MEFSYPSPDVSQKANPNEMFEKDTAPGTIEEKLQIAQKTVNAEYGGGGSGTPNFDVSGFQVITIVIGALIWVGSFLELLKYSFRKIKS